VTKQLSLDIAEQRSRSFTKRANKISRAATKRRKRDDSRQIRLSIALGLVFGFIDDLKRRRKYSDEVVRDSRIPVEPLECSEGERRRYVRYRAALALRGTLDPLPGTAGTRGNCPPERHQTGCPFVRCRYHLWRIDGGPDGNRAGRPGLANVPRDGRGLTLRVLGDVGGDYNGTTLQPRWLEPGAMPVSCALDVADKGKASNQETGDALGRHRTLVGRESHNALPRAREVAEEMGMSEAELLAGLRELGNMR
jgi:hypothetical protein